MFYPQASFARLSILAISAILLPALSHAQSGLWEYRFDLDTSGNICDATVATTSCVRYNGDSAFFPPGTQISVFADFDAQIGNEVPLEFHNFFLPDVVQAFDTIVVEATGEVSGPNPIGRWDLASGVVTMDAGPTDFPNVVQGGAVVDPLDVDSQPLAGTLTCGDEFIPPMPGLPLVGPPAAPGDMTMVGRACVVGPSVNETFFVVLRGDLVPVPEPSASMLAGAALLTLLSLSRETSKERRRS